MEIRLMTIDDYDMVYSLWTSDKNVGLRSLDDSREGIQKFLMRNPKTCFVSVDNDKITGSILAGHDGRRGYIYHAMVSEERRGQGIGTAMVDAACRALKNEGINKAALVVFRKNKKGNDFWQKIGFALRDDLVYRSMSLNEENL